MLRRRGRNVSSIATQPLTQTSARYPAGFCFRSSLCMTFPSHCNSARRAPFRASRPPLSLYIIVFLRCLRSLFEALGSRINSEMIFRRIFKRLFPLTVEFRVGSPSYRTFARLDDNYPPVTIGSEHLVVSPSPAPSPIVERRANDCEYQLVGVDRHIRFNPLRRTMVAMRAVRRRCRGLLPVGRRRVAFDDTEKCLAMG